MAAKLLNPSERLLNINRRELLTSAVGVTAANIVPTVKRRQAGFVNADQSWPTASNALPLNLSATTVRRLLEIQRRNEIRREANLPLLSIAKELRRMKEEDDRQKFSEAFGPFAAKHSEAVWNEVLKSRREALGDANWRPNWIAGMSYQGEVYRILRERFRVEQQKRV